MWKTELIWVKKITPDISKFMVVYNIQLHKSSYKIKKQIPEEPTADIAIDGGVLVENIPIKTLQKPLSQGPKTKWNPPRAISWQN